VIVKPSLFIGTLLLTAGAGFAADKPAAVQLCVQLPEGVALFASKPSPYMRSIGNDAWMLDFDVLLNGHAPERVTKSGADCFRAWLPAEKLKLIKLTFARLPLNLVDAEHPLDLQLKADLWSDGGKVSVERAPWSKLSNTTPGKLAVERAGQPMTDWKTLPSGAYVFNYTPPPQPRATCPITLKVLGSGTVREDRNGDLFREMVESYRVDMLPAVVAKNKLQCEPAEAAQVTVRLVDGIWRNPLEPEIERVRLAEKEPHYQLTVDGTPTAFTNGLKVELKTGQTLEFAQLTDAPAVR
jgi:hypothetical protein